MAKKQSRRSVSLSRTTYERLRTYCETNQVSMSQFVEGRIGDFLGKSPAGVPAVKRPEAAAPIAQAAAPAPRPVFVAPAPAPAPIAAAPAPAVVRPTPAPVAVAAPVAPAPTPAPVAVAPTPAPAPVRSMPPSAPNPGQRSAVVPAKPAKIDEAAAKRAADRIFTF
jgi:hypothetical protein